MKRNLKPFFIFAFVTNLILFLVKFYIGVRTNCLCIYTDSINNFTDTISALLALITTFIICIKPSSKHPFGFGRLEYITGLIMAIVMTLAGLGFAYNSIERFFMPTPVWFFSIYALIICATCIIKLLIGIVFAVQYKKDNSPLLKSIMLDSFLDTGVTLVTLVSFTLSNKVNFVLDAFLGLGISILITILGIRLIKSSFSQLIGNSNLELIKEIEEIINNIESNIEIKSILIHDYGKNMNIAELHLAFTELDNVNSVQNNIKTQLNDKLGISSVVEWEVI